MSGLSPAGRENPTMGRSTKDVGVQVNIKQTTSYYTIRVPGWLVWFGAVAAALLSVYLGTEYVVSMYRPRWHVAPATMEDMGVDGVVLFRKHDRNDDGVLSLDEFEPMAHQMLEREELPIYDDHIEEWDDVITIEAAFTPLRPETMTKDIHDTGGHLDALIGLRSWSKPAVEWKNFGGSDFRGFLPVDGYMLESVGEVYDIITPQSSHAKGATISSNRYNPPELHELPEVILYRLLSLLHPRAFVYSRFAPQGTVATVRAFNDKYVHIVFRSHIEFQLNEPPFFPFWFSPAQLMGDLIMQRDGNKVLFFRAYVPTDNTLNVDMEWLTSPGDASNMEVDIGFMPQMELKSSRSSVHAFHAGTDVRQQRLEAPLDYRSSIESIVWSKEITQTEARRKLEVKMYPFKEVEYYNFSTVFTEAQNQNKPVHSILLWGALDDQSC